MFLTVRDVVRLLDVTEDDLFRMVAEKKLPACKVHGQYRFNRDDVIEWAIAQRQALASSAPAAAETLPGLAEALHAGGVYRDVAGSDKKSALTAALAAIRLPAAVDRSFLVQMLLAREEMASTGIGDGVAIPHVRNPVILPLDRPIVAICYLAHPIEFGALDGKPVHSLFLLFTTSTRGHLHLLSRLMFALRDERFQAALHARADAATLIDELVRLKQQAPQPAARSGEAP